MENSLRSLNGSSEPFGSSWGSSVPLICCCLSMRNLNGLGGAHAFASRPKSLRRFVIITFSHSTSIAEISRLASH